MENLTAPSLLCIVGKEEEEAEHENCSSSERWNARISKLFLADSREREREKGLGKSRGDQSVLI
jgi:hypothetical protein